MIIELRRIRHRPDTIDGHIFIDGVKVCDCAENNKFALAPGTYQIILVKCHQHARKMPCVIINGNPKCNKCMKLDCVSNNTTMPQVCPQIKAGNGVYHREDGSIIVGKHITPGCLSHPKDTFDALYDRIRKNIERGNPVMLTIVSEGSGIRV